MAGEPILELVDLSHYFIHNGQADSVLRHLGLTVGRGELVCLIGRSGSGKSTLLNIVAGFLKPSQGQCLLDGRAVGRPGPDRAMVFQEDALFPWLTVRENVAFGLGGDGWPRERRQREVERLLALVGLAGYGDHLPHALSGGMKQRVALARVLIRSPRLLLMDEPFAALDAQTREEMQELLLGLSYRRQSILFVTHDVGEAVALADRVLLLDRASGAIGAEWAIDLARSRDRNGEGFQRLCARIHRRLRREPADAGPSDVRP
ncbi:ABC transporter ATP-binding protein [Desulfobulbus sp.]|uniref:ABC transporter ATP-binding protein n=1 Tax=Desulfobulbus sp. TaxID=895 RepID=UPI00286EF7EF|nr:ABC transporter ATP-binding protein [Desulfobulbus sp.]